MTLSYSTYSSFKTHYVINGGCYLKTGFSRLRHNRLLKYCLVINSEEVVKSAETFILNVKLVTILFHIKNTKFNTVKGFICLVQTTHS